MLQPEPGQVAFLPVLDAIESFTIESNSPPAEFGRFNGGVVNLTMKSGTNTLSGTLFGFLRHESLNARNYFAAPDSTKPLFRRSQLGAVVGGPVVRNSTFFFADYQGQRQKIERTAISTVPTMLQRQGIFTEPIAGRVPTIYDPIQAAVLEYAPFSSFNPERRFRSRSQPISTHLRVSGSSGQTGTAIPTCLRVNAHQPVGSIQPHFPTAPQFTLGNSSRNPIRGPAYRNVDIAVARRTRLAGSISLEARAEVFNLLNTPALGVPNTVLGSAAFGSITSAGDPRVGQVALKLFF